jgi:hypothetical protein
VSKQEVKDAEFKFWPTYEDGTEPDLVILVGQYYLLFEAKFHSGFGKSQDIEKYQIQREISGGKLEANALGKHFIFIAITAHYSRQHFLEENQNLLNRDFLWINWHQVSLFLQTVIDNEDSLDNESICFANDLYSLFQKKGLRKYAGVQVLAPIKNIIPFSSFLYFDAKTAEHRGDYLGFITVLQIIPSLQAVPQIFFFSNENPFSSIYKIEMELNVPNTIYFVR